MMDINNLPQTIFREYSKNEGLRSDRSAGDRSRHRAKVRQSIKDNIADIISDESIIGKSGDKIIKVPIKGIKEYRFVFGDNGGGAAQGDGNTQPGQVVGKTGQQQGQGNGKGKAGSEAGEDVFETEITLDELKEILFEDLQLPNLRKTSQRVILQKNRAKKDGYRRMGIQVRLDRFKTAKERVKRKKATQRHGESEVDCELCNGSGQIALLHLHSENSPEDMSADAYQYSECKECEGTGKVDKRFRFRREDRRFKHMDVKPKPQSNAAIIFVMDTSGSMDTSKKFLARSFFNILYEFISAKYDRSEVVFISHHTEAQEVDEEAFFHKGESGGTYISSGLNKAIEIINTRYNPSVWNSYLFQASDGDNFYSDNENAMKAVRELCDLCNMFGYVEIKPAENGYYASTLIPPYTEISKEKDNLKIGLIKDKLELFPIIKDWLSISGE